MSKKEKLNRGTLSGIVHRETVSEKKDFKRKPRKWKGILAGLLAVALAAGCLPGSTLTAPAESGGADAVTVRTIDGTNVGGGENADQITKAGDSAVNETDGTRFSKYISSTDTENVFDITLTAATTGNTLQTKEAPDVDVVIVLDVSNTMRYTYSTNGVVASPYTDSRWYSAVQAADSFIEDYAKFTIDSTKRIGVVLFNTDGHTAISMTEVNAGNYSKLENTLYNSVYNIEQSSDYSGSWSRFTNMEAGLALAADMLGSSSGNQQYIIFITDGMPTTFSKTVGGTTGYSPNYSPVYGSGYGGSSDFWDSLLNKQNYSTNYSDKAAVRARQEADRIKNNGVQIYSIGVALGSQYISQWDSSSYSSNNSTIQRTNTSVPYQYEVGQVETSYNSGTGAFGYVSEATQKQNYASWLSGTLSNSGYTESTATGSMRGIGSGEGYYSSADNDKELKAIFDSIMDSIELDVTNKTNAVSVTDIMGTQNGTTAVDTEFLGFFSRNDSGNSTLYQYLPYDSETNACKSNENSVTFDASTNTINWNLEESAHDSTSESNGVTYTYTLTYRVRIEGEIDGMVDGTSYATNSSTTFTYEVVRDGEEKKLTVESPEVEIYHGSFSFRKADQYGTALPDVTFTLSHDPDDCENCEDGIAEDMDANDPNLQAEESSGADGTVRFTDIPSGHWYKLEEDPSTVPDNHAVAAAYYVQVAYGTVTVYESAEMTNEAGETVTAPNKNAVVWTGADEDAAFEIVDPLIELTLHKYDADDEDISAAGAEFIFYKSDEAGTHYAAATSESGGAGDESGTNIYWLDDSAWTENVSEASRFITGANGEFNIRDFAAGTYYLKETAAPDGYAILANPIEIEVGEDGQIKLITPATGVSVDETGVVINVGNVPTIDMSFIKAEIEDGRTYDSITDVSAEADIDFILFRMNDGTKEYYSCDDMDAAYPIVSWVTDLNRATTFVSGEDGEFTVVGLARGTYYLIESGEETVHTDIIEDGDWVITVDYDEDGVLKGSGDTPDGMGDLYFYQTKNGTNYLFDYQEPDVEKVIINPNDSGDESGNVAGSEDGSVKESSYNVGDDIAYEVKITDIPHYSGDFAYFTLTDTLSAGLTCDEEAGMTIVAYEHGEEEGTGGTTLTEDTDYTISVDWYNDKGEKAEIDPDDPDASTAGLHEVISISFVVDGFGENRGDGDEVTNDYTLNKYAEGCLVLKYDAVLGQDALIDEEGRIMDEVSYDMTANPNDVELDYTVNSAYDADAWYELNGVSLIRSKYDGTYTYTFDIDGYAYGEYEGDGYGESNGSWSETWRIITKTGDAADWYTEHESDEDDGYDEDDEVVNEQALAGAGFTLYVEAADGYEDSDKVTWTDKNGREITLVPYSNNFITDGRIVSDGAGELLIRGLAAGRYYLLENTAPDGYVKTGAKFIIEIRAEFYDDPADTASYEKLKAWTVEITDEMTGETNVNTFSVYYTQPAGMGDEVEDETEDADGTVSGSEGTTGWDPAGWIHYTDADGNEYWVYYDVEETEVMNITPGLDKEITDPNDNDTTDPDDPDYNASLKRGEAGADEAAENVSVSEEAKGSSYSVGDSIPYLVTVTGVPGYVGEYPYYTVTDTLSKGLVFDWDVKPVVTAYPYIKEGSAGTAEEAEKTAEEAGEQGEEEVSSGEILTEGVDYILNYGTDEDGHEYLQLDFVVDGYEYTEPGEDGETITNGYTLNAFEGGCLEITYNVILTEDADCNAVYNNNDVVLDFVYNDSYDIDSDEYDNHGHEEDITYAYTFDIDGAAFGPYTGDGWTNEGGSTSPTWRVITKIGPEDYYADGDTDEEDADEDETHTGDDEVVNEKALDGAVFTLYTDRTGINIYTNEVFDGTATSDAQGEIQIKGLSAGTYYLKETKAPESYSRNPHTYVIEITAQYNEDGTLADWGIWIDGTETSHFDVYYDLTEEEKGDLGYDAENGNTNGEGTTGWTNDGSWYTYTDEDGNTIYVKYSVDETEITDSYEADPDPEKVITDPTDTGSTNESVDGYGNAKGSSFNVGDEVDYQVTVCDLPYYDGPFPYFTLTDTLDDGLSYVEAEGVTVMAYQFGSDEGTVLAEDTDYILTVDGQAIILDFVVDGYRESRRSETPGEDSVRNDYTLNDYAEGYLVITYNVILNENAKYNALYNDNDVWLDYVLDSTYDIDGRDGENHGRKEDKTYSYTFDIDGAALGEGLDGSDSETWRIITKTGEDAYNGEGSDGIVHSYALEGAEFGLYTDEACTTLCANEVFDGTVTSNEQGELMIKGLSTGTYYLTETKAPEGYAANDAVYVIRIDGTFRRDGKLTGWSVKINGEETAHFDVLYDEDTEGLDEWNRTINNDENGDALIEGLVPVYDEDGSIICWMDYTVDEFVVHNALIPETIPQTGMRLLLILLLAFGGAGMMGIALRLSGGKRKRKKAA